MGADFHRVVMAALAAGLLVIPGCGAGASGPGGTGDGQGSTTTAPASVQPKIVAASLDGTNSLKLTFSEPMQPAQNVDPAKFRLTIGYYGTKAATSAGKYSYAYYYSGAYSDYSRYYADVAPVQGILSESTPSTEAVLLMGASFDVTQACQQIAAHAKSGLFLHYASAGSPTIEDEQGKLLQSVGDFWTAPPGKHPLAGASGPIPVTVHCN